LQSFFYFKRLRAEGEGTMKKEIEKKLADHIRHNFKKVEGWSESLDVIKIQYSACDAGKLYGWHQFFDFSGNVLSEKSEKVQAFKAWAKKEERLFCEIANKEGIATAIKQTAIR